jgi:hypothetical protein
VDEGKIDEAVALARKHFTQLPGLMEQFVNALVEAGAKDAAVALMTEQAEKKNAYWNYKEKLIGKIDNALLDENAYSKLKKLVDENCKIYR